jgi:hypothetical protein
LYRRAERDPAVRRARGLLRSSGTTWTLMSPARRMISCAASRAESPTSANAATSMTIWVKLLACA